MAEIFVSYARKDKDVVNQIMTELHALGFDYWMDSRNIQGGDWWTEKIVGGIKRCRVFLLFMSGASMRSRNVQREVQLAHEKGKKIVILRLEDVDVPDALSLQLTGIQWTDYSSPDWKSRMTIALQPSPPSRGNTPPSKPKAATKPKKPTKATSSKKPSANLSTAQDIASDQETLFSRGGAYYPDECDESLVQLDELSREISQSWDNAPVDYKQMISKIYLLDKVTTIRNLIREFRVACPPGLDGKRQKIRRELQHLRDDLSIK